MIIDLRSDTVTQPTDAMWDAMRNAPLGDDVLGDEPTVTELEDRCSKLLGKEAALFTPSGTMANQLAIRTVTTPGDEIIAHRDSHIIHYETGAPAALSGCSVWTLEGSRGQFNADEVLAGIRHDDVHYPCTRMVVVENTQNRTGGTVWSLEDFRDVSTMSRQHGLHVHVDGARLMNASVAGGYSPAEFVAEADSTTLCFSKALGAPVGSILAGSSEMIRGARRYRKMFGGGMRQSGMLAAAAIFALEHHVDGLAMDHENARKLSSMLDGIDGLTVPVPESNMVYITIDPSIGSAADLCRRLHESDVLVLDIDSDRVRAVTHHQVDGEMIDRAAEMTIEAVSRMKEDR